MIVMEYITVYIMLHIIGEVVIFFLRTGILSLSTKKLHSNIQSFTHHTFIEPLLCAWIVLGVGSLPLGCSHSNK